MENEEQKVGYFPEILTLPNIDAGELESIFARMEKGFEYSLEISVRRDGTAKVILWKK